MPELRTRKHPLCVPGRSNRPNAVVPILNPRQRGSDPGELTEAVGDADAIRSTALGIRNLRRVADMLLPATTTRPGEPYDELADMYGRLLGQWTLELNHVAAIVGGVTSQEK